MARNCNSFSHSYICSRRRRLSATGEGFEDAQFEEVPPSDLFQAASAPWAVSQPPPFLVSSHCLAASEFSLPPPKFAGESRFGWQCRRHCLPARVAVVNGTSLDAIIVAIDVVCIVVRKHRGIPCRDRVVLVARAGRQELSRSKGYPRNRRPKPHIVLRLGTRAESSRAQVALVVCWLLTCNMLWKCVQAMFVSQFLPSRFFVGGEFVALRRLCCHIYRDIVI